MVEIKGPFGLMGPLLGSFGWSFQSLPLIIEIIDLVIFSPHKRTCSNISGNAYASYLLDLSRSWIAFFRLNVAIQKTVSHAMDAWFGSMNRTRYKDVPIRDSWGVGVTQKKRAALKSLAADKRHVLLHAGIVCNCCFSAYDTGKC